MIEKCSPLSMVLHMQLGNESIYVTIEFGSAVDIYRSIVGIAAWMTMKMKMKMKRKYENFR